MWIGDREGLKFNIQNIIIYKNDDIEMWDKIFSVNPEKRRELKINKSTLWYQQKKIKEGKTIKVYDKIKVRMG